MNNDPTLVGCRNGGDSVTGVFPIFVLSTSGQTHLLSLPSPSRIVDVIVING